MNKNCVEHRTDAIYVAIYVTISVQSFFVKCDD